MRRIWYRRILIWTALFAAAFIGLSYGPQLFERSRNQEVNAEEFGEDTVLLGGMPVGIYLETKGVMVLGTEKIESVDGNDYEPARNLVKPGDYIMAVNGTAVESKEQLAETVNELNSREVVLELKREEEPLTVRLHSVCVGMEDYKLGIWVRDNTQGLGTVTYLTSDSKFGALGHGIHDIDTNALFSISDGRLYDTSIRSVIKGQNGQPGSMEGIIVYNRYNDLGTIEKNTEAGIYGTLEKMDRLFGEQIPVETAAKETVTKGPAQIRSCVDNTVEYYDIEILEIDLSEREINKGLVIQVTDPALLEKTGGIVQGMSGSPIIQNGKLVGAVTHVFVNDPAKGYGIFIEKMMEQSEDLS